MDPSTPSPFIDWNQPNLKDAWTRFSKHVELMFSGPLNGKSNAVKCSYLLIWVGEKGRDIFSTFVVLDASENNPTEYLRLKDNQDPEVHKFYIVSTAKQPLLCKNSIVSLGLIKFLNDVTKKPDQTVNRILSEYEDVFQGIGKLEETRPPNTNSKKFSKLDARHGYWSMELNDESANLTAFNTAFGRFCFQQYPFGLNCAQDNFQGKMEEIFAELIEMAGLGLLINDIVVHGATDEEHNSNLEKTLQVAHEKGVRFNREKCIFGKTEIPYFGHILTSEGIKPDPNKILAIRQMPKPKGPEE
ncbi:hypothetical protein QYM36_016010 [Artemia franciscana]|uniref:Reverse transcriptase domain-containing protein n=1 Tax=Artemia franciscana TaxID=6661 RepID=A0AA88KTB4_ARTSF|nr:hypothetical protein QYM36_016010 [Artemia franciscana]